MTEPHPAVAADPLLTWYSYAARDLPWRRPDISAWQVLISEIMLQQTPVARVAPIWEQWVRRWPAPSAMAAETPAEVLRAWGRLGYPRRALRLHECAGILATRYHDEVPADVDTLLALPGVGAYTARAVACFAHKMAVPVVDTNVRRVVARAVHGRADADRPRSGDLDDVAALLPDQRDDAVVFSAALMELGALICTAHTPDCRQCPLSDCAWRRAGHPPSTTTRRSQHYAGTDRQARGRLMEVLRQATAPVPRSRLDVAWPQDPGQRLRALDSLLRDGLVEQTTDGNFALAGESANRPEP